MSLSEEEIFVGIKIIQRRKYPSGELQNDSESSNMQMMHARKDKRRTSSRQACAIYIYGSSENYKNLPSSKLCTISLNSKVFENIYLSSPSDRSAAKWRGILHTNQLINTKQRQAFLKDMNAIRINSTGPPNNPASAF